MTTPASREPLRWEPAQGKRRKPFAPLDFILRRGAALLFLGAGLALLFAALLLPRARPVYETDAVLMIDPAKEPTLSGRERDPIPGNIGDWTRTQMTRITSAPVLAAALARLPPADRPGFLRPEPGHPSNPFLLMRRIKVREVPRTYLVNVSIRASAPEGLAPALNAVLDVFIEKLQREYEMNYARRLAYLLEERDKIAARLHEEEARILALAGETGNKAFLHEGYTVHLNKVEHLQRLYWEAFAQQTVLTAEHEKVVQDRMKLAQLDLQAFADERVADNFGINRIEQWTYEQLQQMRASIDGLTEDNRDRQYVEARMQAMTEYLNQYKQRVNDETIVNLEQKQTYEQQVKELLAQSAAEAAVRAAENLAARLEEARAEADRISLAIFEASAPVLARSQLRDRLQALNARIDDTEMEAKTPVRVQVDERAEPPTRPVSSSYLKFLMLALVMGLGLAIAAVLLYELLDDRLRTARDIEGVLGAPGPDPISAYVADITACPDFFDASRTGGGGLAAESARRALGELAARLARDQRGQGGGIYCLAGLEARCGCTSLAVNLAHELRGFCGPVLLIELNVARPGLRCALGVAGGPGLESWLRGTAALEQVVHRDAARQIDVLFADGSGRPPQVDNLPALLAGLRQTYAVILLDGGIVSDGLALLAAGESDGVLLVARAKQTHYRDLRNGLVLLAQLRVPAVTAVLNFSAARPQEKLMKLGDWGIQWVSTWAARVRKRVSLFSAGAR